MDMAQDRAFLRVPPFPGAGRAELAVDRGSDVSLEDDHIDSLLSLTAEMKVGGDYWAPHPPLPDEPYILARIADPRTRPAVQAGRGDRIVYWSDRAGPASPGSVHVSGAADPWHLVRGATRVVVDANDELALIAAVAGVQLTCIGEGLFAALESGGRPALRQVFREIVAGVAYRDPFTGETMDAESAIHLCGFWRRLIDSNRDVSSAAGFAFWKRPTVAPLLWGGSEVNFSSKPVDASGAGKIAVWKSRLPVALLAELEQTPDKLIEVEDGFIRSAGLGADCVPPLSIVVDRSGVHFDPRGPSDLERLIEVGEFPGEILERARTLRELIVSSGVSKYGAGEIAQVSRDAGRRYILVPGQVEDDRSVLCGGGGVRGNLDLLRRVRADAPDAYILYKPHPDIEAGHRVGAIPEEQCLEVADEIVRNQSISSLITAVDEVHVNTSLAGFEALLRLKPVTTHGVPFYAGWGLTRDLGAVPVRRTAKRTIDELVAGVLLLYPRYLDPLTGLPCPPEILVRRISEGGSEPRGGVVVQMRRFQGRLRKRMASLGLAK